MDRLIMTTVSQTRPAGGHRGLAAPGTPPVRAVAHRGRPPCRGRQKSTLSQLESGTGNPAWETLWRSASRWTCRSPGWSTPPRAYTQVIRARRGAYRWPRPKPTTRATLLVAGRPGVHHRHLPGPRPSLATRGRPSRTCRRGRARGAQHRPGPGRGDPASRLSSHRANYIRYPGDVAHCVRGAGTGHAGRPALRTHIGEHI